MKYKYETEVVTSTQTQVRANCSGLLFINSGTVTVYVNAFPLLAGASLSLDTSDDAIDMTIYSLSWAAAGGSLTIWRKNYIK